MKQEKTRQKSVDEMIQSISKNKRPKTNKKYITKNKCIRQTKKKK